MQKLKHHRRIGIDLCHSNNINIISLDMEERRGPERRDRRPDVRRGKDVDPEDIGDGPFEVVAVQPRDQNLAFLVEDEDARDHYFEGTGGDGDR